MVDPAGHGGHARQGEELLAGSDSEHRQGTLVGIDWQAEQALIELDGARLVPHEERKVVELTQRQETFPRCGLGCR